MKKLYEYEGWPTTRCYPRTLAEAFPQDGMGDWCEVYKRSTPTWHDVVLYVLTLLVIGVIIKMLGWL